MSKIYFASFADSKYQQSIERLKKETEAFGFSERSFFSEKDLPQEFFQNLNPKIYRRGYGYWSWKPYVVQTMLKQMEMGDVLAYSDAGTQWHVSGKPRFDQYVGMLTEAKPFVVFQQPFLVKDWTKGDVIQYLCPDNWQQYAMCLQIWAGAFIMMKTPTSVELIEKWVDIVRNHIDLMTDKASSARNLSGFREHRHDQAVFSLLVQQAAHSEISWEEVEPLDGNWSGHEKYPLWAKRDKKSTFCKKVWKRITGFFFAKYLTHFKGFYIVATRTCGLTLLLTNKFAHMITISTCNLLGGGNSKQLRCASRKTKISSTSVPKSSASFATLRETNTLCESIEERRAA